MLPSKRQWSKWSLPSRLTAIGTYVGIAGLLLALFAFLAEPLWRREAKTPTSVSVVGDACLVNSTVVGNVVVDKRVQFNEANRPKGLLPQSFYLDHNLFPIRGFPFDIYLGMDAEDFRIRHGSIVVRQSCAIQGFQIYGLRPGAIEFDRKSGWINESSTFFLFDAGKLVAAMLYIVVPPGSEAQLAGTLDRTHPVGYGSRYDQDSDYLWASEKGRPLEILSLHHGLSSGENVFTLFRSDFPLNDLVLPIFNESIRVPSDQVALRLVLERFRQILDSDVYRREVFPSLGIAPVCREVALHNIEEALR